MFRHFLDVHAAFRRNDEGDAAGRAIDERRQIEFARDRRAVFDVETVHNASVRAGLVRNERHAQHALGFFANVIDRTDDFHAAALAAAARMNLGLHHPDGTAQLLGRGHRLIDGKGGKAAWHRYAKSAQDFFGLIFMDVHAATLRKSLMNWWNLTAGQSGRRHNSSRPVARKTKARGGRHAKSL